jgi:hypothetical protein
VSVVVPSHRRASATARAASDELDRQRGRAPIGGSDVGARAAGGSRRCRRTCRHRGAVAVLSYNARQERSAGQPGARPRYVPYPDVRRARIGVRVRASADAHRRVPDGQAVSENVTPITDWTPPAASSPLGAGTGGYRTPRPNDSRSRSRAAQNGITSLSPRDRLASVTQCSRTNLALWPSAPATRRPGRRSDGPAELSEASDPTAFRTDVARDPTVAGGCQRAERRRINSVATPRSSEGAVAVRCRRG